ncbi:hypothetical protein Salat_0473500 [Sesamum alatum]|uniref:Uncharacterized protein n=1 Tax=Sesamum alatum TaxID=300844 RepID=A0AAE1Z3P0_9LAMI|nr:hypothetical protein Salat_0473500 [Sesamum alatum]
MAWCKFWPFLMHSSRRPANMTFSSLLARILYLLSTIMEKNESQNPEISNQLKNIVEIYIQHHSANSLRSKATPYVKMKEENSSIAYELEVLNFLEIHIGAGSGTLSQNIHKPS